jgi:hypothetical protein
MNQRKPAAPAMHPDTSGEGSAGLNREIQAKIGQKLRAIYDEIVQEGVPERFSSLLRQLDKPADEGPSE